jgi:hypothetical protein
MIKKMTQSLALALLPISLAFAGMVSEFPVTIEDNPDGGGSVYGTLATVRQSDNDIEQIGCRLLSSTFGGDSGESGRCDATASDGRQVFCWTGDPVMINTIRGMDSFSYVWFQWFSDGTCEAISVATRSRYMPDLSKAAKNNTHDGD